MDARLDTVARRASRAVAAHHRGFTTTADLYQQAWVWLLAHPGRVQAKLDAYGAPYPTLTADVRAHLERVVQADRDAVRPTGAGPHWAPAMVRLALVAGQLWRVVDDTLGTADAVLLREHYGNGKPWSVVAHQTGLTEPAVRVRASRAVAAVCARLNRPS